MKHLIALLAFAALSAVSAISAAEPLKNCNDPGANCGPVPLPPPVPAVPPPPLPPPPPTPPAPPLVPDEAHAACDGKKSGTPMAYVGKDGTTMRGTCETRFFSKFFEVRSITHLDNRARLP